MHCPSLSELPNCPPDKTGWPWTEESPNLPDNMSDGTFWPKISIVTPTYNQGEYLEEMIRSVLLQGYPNIEFIVIDGGSTDNTVDIIKKYENFLTYWISEPDRGQSNAINKGLSHCTGDIFNWLNSDDLLCAESLGAIGRAWDDEPGNIITGTVEDFNESGVQKIFIPSGITKENFIELYCEGKTNDLVWHQPGIFSPLAAVKKVGGVREDAHFTMDRFLMIDLLQEHNVVYISEVLSRFRRHNKSKSESSLGHQFGLEFMEKIKSMKELPWGLSEKKVNKYHVHLLIRGGASEALRGNFFYTIKRIVEALAISPYRTLIEMCKLFQCLKKTKKTIKIV